MLTALVLFPILILGDQWHNHQIVELRHHEAKAAAGDRRRRGLVLALAWVFVRWPILMPLAIIGTLPFRIPLESGGETANLLVPLYVVIARAASSAAMFLPPPAREAAGRGGWRKRWPIFVVLYAAAGALLGGLLQRPAGSLLLPRPLHPRLHPPARAPLGPPPARLRSSSWSRSRPSLFVADRQRRVRQPQPLLERGGDPLERIPHLLPRQLGLLGPEHLRPLPGAGPGRRHRGDALGPRAARLLAARRRGRWCSGSASPRPSASRASSPCSPASRCWRRCAGAGAGRSAVVLVGTVGAVARRDPGRRQVARPLALSNASTSTPAAAPTWSPAAPNSSPSGRSGATARAPSSTPTATTRQEKAPVTISHTEPVTVAAEQGLIGLVFYLGLIAIALWTLGAGLWARGARPPARRSPTPPAPRCSPPSSPCWSTRSPTPASSRTRSPGSSWPSELRWRPLRRIVAGRGRVARPRRRPPRPTAVGEPASRLVADVGIPAPPGDDRRRLHRGEHPLEADRGGAAAALHAPPHAPATTAPPRSSSPPSSRSRSSSASG